MPFKIDNSTELTCLYCRSKFLASQENILVNTDGEYAVCPNCGKSSDIQHHLMTGFPPIFQLMPPSYIETYFHLRWIKRNEPERFQAMLDWVKNTKNE